MAAPTPTPVNPDSAIGVSMTRCSPNSLSRPCVTLYAPSYRPTSSPITNTRGSRRISSRRARFSASRYVMTATPLVLVHVGEQPLRGRLRGSLGKRHRLVDGIVDGSLDGRDIGLGEHSLARAPVDEQGDGIPLPLALHLLARAIHRAGRIAHGVATEPVGLRLDERG